MACGPEGAGQCIGPNICCGASFGCLMGTTETEVCQKENESTVPCTVKGRQCGVNNNGNCVADSLCCDEGGYIHYLVGNSARGEGIDKDCKIQFVTRRHKIDIRFNFQFIGSYM